MRAPAAVVALLFCVAAAACGPNYSSGTYCQSGPKHGTQCYYNPGSGTGNGPGQDPYKGVGDNPNARFQPTR
jgi:hypothetical protein